MAKKVKEGMSGEEPKKASKAGVRVQSRSGGSAPQAPENAPEPEEDSPDEPSDAEQAEDLVLRGGESSAIDQAEADELPQASEETEAAREGDEEEVAATALGSQRYVMAGFFAAAMIGAFVLGKAIHGMWATFSNKDWFSRSVPLLASIADDDKTTYAMLLGAVISLIVVIRAYRKPDVRAWTDEVAAELAKVKWPTRKDVSNSTIVVIAASTIATVYLALLDRLWSFVTNLVYGSGT